MQVLTGYGRSFWSATRVRALGPKREAASSHSIGSLASSYGRDGRGVRVAEGRKRKAMEDAISRAHMASESQRCCGVIEGGASGGKKKAWIRATEKRAARMLVAKTARMRCLCDGEAGGRIPVRPSDAAPDRLLKALIGAPAESDDLARNENIRQLLHNEVPDIPNIRKEFN